MLKQAMNEDSDYMKQIGFYKHTYPSIYDLQFLQQNKLRDSSNIRKVDNNMLAYAKEMFDKEATSHDDLFDSFRLSLMFWH